jgi:FixJ family two-component response regulator
MKAGAVEFLTKPFNDDVLLAAIFITGLLREAVRSQVLEQGAIACLFKPFNDTALLEAVSSALNQK